jgi:hypothetical protein
MASTRLGGVVSRQGRAAALCETEIVVLFIGAPRQPQTFIVWFEFRTGGRRHRYFDRTTVFRSSYQFCTITIVAG